MITEFLYSTHSKRINKHKIVVDAANSAKTYAILVGGLIKPATFVYDCTNKRLIIPNTFSNEKNM